MPGQGNHGTVVRAKGRPRVVNIDIQVGAHLAERCAQATVGAHAACDHQPPQARLIQRASALLRQHAHHGLLEAPREVGPGLSIQIGTGFASRIEYGRLQSAEAEVEARTVEHRPRKPETIRDACLGERRQSGTTRIGQAKLRHLVESLPAASSIDSPRIR